MKEIIFGVIAGVISSLGMGGGTILILLLNFFTGLEQHVIFGVNLFFFIPTSIISILINHKRKLINYKKSFIIILYGIIGAIVGEKISVIIESQKLRKYFGIFLISISLFEIYSFITQKYIINKKENNN